MSHIEWKQMPNSEATERTSPEISSYDKRNAPMTIQLERRSAIFQNIVGRVESPPPKKKKHIKNQWQVSTDVKTVRALANKKPRYNPQNSMHLVTHVACPQYLAVCALCHG